MVSIVPGGGCAGGAAVIVIVTVAVFDVTEPADKLYVKLSVPVAVALGVYVITLVAAFTSNGVVLCVGWETMLTNASPEFGTEIDTGLPAEAVTFRFWAVSTGVMGTERLDSVVVTWAWPTPPAEDET